ncbi:hypothetical protein [Krasilnikovia sp. MM14-A1004]|uniref:hypothetical protein n=1 Tax=Krasilnikovia sp. MM14-A1004 TaxID=3373541 RepID=UPI00399CB5D3
MTHPGHGSTATTGNDTLDELRRISVELRALSRAARAGGGRDTRVEGADPSGAVTVTMDGALHVVEVRVDARWEQRLSRMELGDALSTAYGRAVLQALTAGSEAVDEAVAGTDRAALEHEVDAELRSRHGRPFDPDDLRYELARQLDQNDMLLRYADTPDAPPPPAPETSVSGPTGFVTVVLRNGQVAEVRVLASRIPAMATNGTIAGEALAAFRAAARTGA